VSGLISRKSKPTSDDRPGPKSLEVKGVRYSNAAAKFWPSLIDEAAEDFPDCTRIDLSAPASHKLERSLLFPELALEKGVNSFWRSNAGDLMKETLAELELLGPPSPVQVRLFAGKEEFLATEFPLDCVDSETFPYLIAWPLEWAGIPADVWNNEALDGDFTGEDKQRGIVYRIVFHMANTHLSEGLYRRDFSIVHSVSMFA
jgi:hypothetical protein